MRPTFILVTDVEGRRHWLNVSEITGVRESGNGQWAYIFTSSNQMPTNDSNYVKVNSTGDQIMQSIGLSTRENT